MRTIQNPILPGFHPDPSIIRVGDDYYLATSTFEWFPGVAIYHSRDLVHWEFAAWPLRRVSQLDMRGIPSSCGIFAPCLSWCDGTFYLIYTIVRTASSMQDTHNYLVTCDSIDGDWSEPIYLGSTGFDPSLFHDADGRKWLVNRDCDVRWFQSPRGGILLREYDPAAQKLVGPEHRIFRTSGIIGAEGPHLYRHGGYYYLMLAEGGTDCNHVVSMARSRSITGSYEVDPENPMLTSRDDPFLPLQKAGHASLVETQDGQWYIAHLVGRPLPNKGRCILGRETALEKVFWSEDGWLRLSHGGYTPALTVEAPDLPEHPYPALPVRDDFDRDTLGYPYQTLRVPLTHQIMTLTERPGWLRLYGRDSLHSRYEQSLVARRQQAFCYIAETKIDYTPENYHQTAGLICIYDTECFFYLYLTRAEDGKKRLGILKSDLGRISYPVGAGIEVPEGAYYLLAAVHYDQLRFCASPDGTVWEPIGPCFDYSILSDDYYIENGEYRFTGAFVGLCCQDCGVRDSHADFDYLDYREEDPGRLS